MSATDTTDMFGVAPLSTIICPKCVRGEMVYGTLIQPCPTEIVAQQSWCSKAFCKNCRFEWYVCRKCPNARQILDSRQKLSTHTYKFHKGTLPVTRSFKGRATAVLTQKRKQNVEEVGGFNDNSSRTTYASLPRANLTETNIQDPTSPETSRLVASTMINTPSKNYGGIPTAVLNCNFTREESKDFFASNYHRQLGLSYLVSEAFYSGNKAAEDITTDDLEMFMSLTLLVKELSTNHCDILGRFLEMLFQRFDAAESWSRSHLSSVPSFSKPVIIPPIPHTSLDIRSKIRMGRRSFFNLLPHPLVRKMDNKSDEHVYVLPSDCILHFLAQGIAPLEFNQSNVKYPVTYLNETPRGVEIAKTLNKIKRNKLSSRRHFNLSFLEWKDDCESAKSNRMSKFPLWIFTITIFRAGETRDSPECTYPVAIGPKGKSHEPVKAIIKEDLLRLRTTAQLGFFGWSEDKRPFPCSFSADLFMSLGDQPERRGGNVLQLGNSRNHARWRYACDYSQLLDVIPSCPKCFEVMLECDSVTSRNDPDVDRNRWISMGCKVCSNWMYNSADPILTFRRSENFPKDYLLGGDEGTGPLTPIQLNYTILTQVINLSFEMVAKGEWKMGQGLVYMTDNCLNKKYAHVHVTRASNRCLYNKAKNNDQRNTVRSDQIIADQLINPNRYLPLPIPSLYTRGVPLHAFTDTPMHLIPLGIGKSVFFRIMTWSARRGRKKVFVAIAKSLMEDINSLNLPWLTLLPSTIKDKWGGWVSKNYASLLRVALWIFAPIMTIDDADAYSDPIGDPKKWTVKMYQVWLRVRGLDSKGKRQTLSERVLPFFDEGCVAPPILPQQYASANEMIEMLQSLVLMVATIFQKSVNENTKTLLELRIRLFLTRFQRFDEPMRKKDRNPNWLSTYNFMCLLNLPATIEEFGPVRQWYEGKWLGERYVSTVKSERLKCPLVNLHYVLLRNLHRNKSIDSLNNKSDHVNKREQLPMNTKVFTSLDDLQGSFLSRNPFPITRMKNGSLYALFFEGDRKSLKRVKGRRLLKKNLEPPGNLQYGLLYWKYERTDEVDDFNVGDVSDYGVLLSSHGSDQQGIYTVVWKNWSTDMFGEYDFNREARTEIASAMTDTHDEADPGLINYSEVIQPFVYDEEYYNDTTLFTTIKTEESSRPDFD
jgi:hypothetical protein